MGSASLPSGHVRGFDQAVMPNSRLVVIPYPYDAPSRWELRLYLEPRQQVYVGLALLGCLCTLMALVVALEMRERIQDQKERRTLAPALPL